MANAQSGNIAGLLSTAFNPMANAPSGGDASAIGAVPAPQTSFASAGPIQTGLGNAGSITQSYGPADNYSADREQVTDALMARVNPQLDIQQQQAAAAARRPGHSLRQRRLQQRFYAVQPADATTRASPRSRKVARSR